MGEKKTGVIDAPNAIWARKALYEQGILIKKITQLHRFQKLASRRLGIKSVEITALMRHLTTLNRSGIGLMQAFDVLKKEQKNPAMTRLIASIQADLRAGLMLSDALRRYPTLFNELFCSMIYAGEQSGTLDVMLSQVASHQEKSIHLRKKIKKACIYPISVVLIGVIVMIALVFFVIPQFERLFHDFGADMPTFTQNIIIFSKFIQSYGLIIMLSISFCSYIWIKFAHHWPILTIQRDKCLLTLPIVGDVLKKIAITRFMRMLSIAFTAGLPLTEALATIANTTGDRLYTKAILNIKQNLLSGQSLHQSMQNNPLFPTLATQMIGIGEESGCLESMLNQIADFYEQEFEHFIDGFHSALEPFIMAALGLLVGSVVVAMYLPILKLGMVV